MLVKTRYLIEGCILSKEIRGLSNRPIMYEKTIMTRQLIEALQAFLITEVSIENFDSWKEISAERSNGSRMG
ncbi:hypothetical protein AAEY33_00040 [Peribacillus simplex]|uniref:hypothetical protein n=1 Tax=Peribacillus simplex TaxID=1478 RepID=UPI003262EF42